MHYFEKFLLKVFNLMKNNRSLPLVVVGGPTGTGKTKLSIEIAKYYDGEIINADAIQIYKGMDIATNKATESERQGIVHHLLGCKDVEKLDFTVHDFQEMALEKIKDIQSRNKLAVLVGGTNYYIESILWPKLIGVNNNESDQNDIADNDPLNNQELHELLQILDPESAAMLHPNNRRKVLRAIEIARNSKKTQFNHLNEQEKSRRFGLNEVVFLWVTSNKEALFPRLERRVDEMVELGLIDELWQMHELFTRICPAGNYTQGVFQAIGFKEFRDYLTYDGQDAWERETRLSACVEKLKIANKQYVKVQTKWLKNRFLRRAGDDENVPLFQLDSSDASRWDENVGQKSIRIIEAVRKATQTSSYTEFVGQLEVAPEPLRDEVTNTPGQHVCDLCDGQLFVTVEQWHAHLHSRRHEKRKKKSRQTLEKGRVEI